MSSTTPSAEEDERQRARLASVIERCREEIEQLWMERVPASVKGRPVSASELRNSMPEYLLRLAEGLRGKDTVEAGGLSSWEDVAKEHAETRVHLGFDIDQLVHEFIVLRRVLFEIIGREEGSRFDLAQASRLADLIEGAIQAAVQSYIESRDYELRRQEAEHVGFIAHELRSPLNTAVLGVAQLRLTLSLTPEQARVLDMVDRNQSKLADLIDGVLLLEREGHELEPHPQVCTLGQIVAEPLASAKLAAEAKGLRLEARFDPDLAVLADPAVAASAVDNVLQNAVKYTDKGHVELTADAGATEIGIHVRDTGPGISKEELLTVFDPFRRGRSGKPGTGLGLAIARRAIELQKGTIHAESGPEPGCHFWLTLPKPRH